MRPLTKLALFSVLLLLAGFSTREKFLPEGSPYSVAPENAAVSDSAASARSIINYIEKGTMRASWYGPGFHGRLTANGEIYDQEALTVAHKEFRFGTLLRLTNTGNNRTVIVRVNDRGPYIAGRQIDLSKAAARELGLLHKGVGRLKVEQLSLQGVNFPVIPFN